MFSEVHSTLQCNEGVTLIELMIGVGIIGILAAVAVPNFLAYRDHARVAAAKATMESVRGALARFAADEPSNLYPSAKSSPILDISTYAKMQVNLSAYGANLPDTPGSTGILTAAYDGTDGSNYSILVTTTVSTSVPGYQFTVSPGGITNITPAP
jgi:prepilin-type N-terminal cleavage/methylation domain-containing protein